MHNGNAKLGNHDRQSETIHILTKILITRIVRRNRSQANKTINTGNCNATAKTGSSIISVTKTVGIEIVTDNLEILITISS